MPGMSSKRKTKGTAKTTALKLFGVPGKMETADDRAAIIMILENSPDPRFRALCRMAQDPIYKHTSFAKLCENLALNYHHVAKEYREIQRSIGLVRAGAHLPELMEQVMVDAKSQYKRCQRCKGTKKITVGKGDAVQEVECPTCEGTGNVYVLGDADRLRMALDMFSLGKTGSGIAVNLDLRNTDKPEGLGELADSLQGIIEGKVEGPTQ